MKVAVCIQLLTFMVFLSTVESAIRQLYDLYQNAHPAWAEDNVLLQPITDRQITRLHDGQGHIYNVVDSCRVAPSEAVMRQLYDRHNHAHYIYDNNDLVVLMPAGSGITWLHDRTRHIYNVIDRKRVVLTHDLLIPYYDFHTRPYLVGPGRQLVTPITDHEITWLADPLHFIFAVNPDGILVPRGRWTQELYDIHTRPHYIDAQNRLLTPIMTPGTRTLLDGNRVVYEVIDNDRVVRRGVLDQILYDALNQPYFIDAENRLLSPVLLPGTLNLRAENGAIYFIIDNTRVERRGPPTPAITHHLYDAQNNRYGVAADNQVVTSLPRSNMRLNDGHGNYFRVNSRDRAIPCDPPGRRQRPDPNPRDGDRIEVHGHFLGRYRGEEIELPSGEHIPYHPEIGHSVVRPEGTYSYYRGTEWKIVH